MAGNDVLNICFHGIAPRKGARVRPGFRRWQADDQSNPGCDLAAAAIVTRLIIQAAQPGSPRRARNASPGVGRPGAAGGERR
jgi:hypothetical protein